MGNELLSASVWAEHGKSRWAAGAVLAASLAVAAAFASAPAAAAPLAENADVKMENLMKPTELPDVVLGKEDAPNVVVEYSSLTCPHCADFHKDVMPKLKEKHVDTGKVKYILREFPLDNVAAAGFMLARCVDKVKHYDLIETLYAHQEQWAFKNAPLPELKKFSKQAGFTDETFDKCLGDEQLLKKIEASREYAHKEFGVRSTPTLFVNGKRIKGTNTLEQIEELLAQPAAPAAPAAQPAQGK